MAVTIDGTTGITTPGLTNTGVDTLVDLTTTGNTVIGNATTDTLVVGVDGIVKDTFGNVGIGTASPTSKFNLEGANATDGPNAKFLAVIRNSGTQSAGSGTGIAFAQKMSSFSANLATIEAIKENATTDDYASSLKFLTRLNANNLTERMRIDSSGNLIVGNTTAYGIINGYTSQGGTQLSVLHGGAGSYPKVSGISFGQPTTSITVSNNGGTTAFTGGAGIYANNTASSGNPTSLVFWTNSAGTPVEAMRIDSSGNVGIGTNNTAGYALAIERTSNNALMKLTAITSGGAGIDLINSGAGGEVSYLGTGASGQALTFRAGSSTERMRIDSAGSVGIGIGALSFSTQVTPSLTMYGGNTGLCLRNATTGTGNNVGTDIFLGTNGDLNIDQRSAQAIYIQTTASTRMAITAAGDVGINTTTPSKKFEVYTSANNLQIGAIVRNDQAGTGVAAIGFNVSSPATSDASVTKAGIGLVRNATFGRGVLTFYNDNSAANNDFTTANAVMSIDSSGVLGFNSGYGSAATAYGCRAWVNFNGTTVTPSTIRGSGNVSSITRTSAGVYTVNFATAIVDANYAVNVFAKTTTAGVNRTAFANGDSASTGGSTQLAASYSFLTTNLAGTPSDTDFVNFAVFR